MKLSTGEPPEQNPSGVNRQGWTLRASARVILARSGNIAIVTGLLMCPLIAGFGILADSAMESAGKPEVAAPATLGDSPLRNSRL